MDEYKLQDELSNAYQPNDFDQNIDDIIYDSSLPQPAESDINHPLDKIVFLLPPEVKERWTDEAIAKLNELAQAEINRIVNKAMEISQGKEKTLENDVQDAHPNIVSSTPNKLNAIGFGLIGAVSSQALGSAIDLDANATYSISIAAFIMLIGASLAFKK